MAWPLFDAVVRVLARRALDAARKAPLAAAAVVALFLASPALLARTAASVADASAEALADPAAARVVVLSMLVPAVAAGAAGSRIASPPARLGLQTATAPVRDSWLALAAALPTLLAGAAFAPLVLSVVVPFTLASPGGVAATGALLSTLVAGVAAGAGAAQLAQSARRGSRPAAVGVVALACAVVASIVVRPEIEPSRAVAGVLSGGGRAGAIALACAVVTGTALVCWLLARRAAVETAATEPRPSALGPLLARLPVPAFGLAVLTRRPDTRGALLAGAFLGTAAAAAGRLVGLDPGSASLLGLSAVLSAAVVAPLAVGGAIDDVRWLLATAPRGATAVAAGWLAGAALATGGALVPVALVSAATGGTTSDLLGGMLVGVTLATGAGLLAGCLAPWRRAGVGDQLGALAVLAAVAAGAAALAVGADALGSRAGVGDRWTALAAAAAPVVAGVVLCIRRTRIG